MKFEPHNNYPECLVNANNTVMKTDSIDKFPSFVHNVVFEGSPTQESYKAELIKGTLVLERKTVKRELKVISMKSKKGESFYDYNIIKHFMQKQSKYFMPKSTVPCLVVNKNYNVIIAPIWFNEDYFVAFTPDN
jgi:hypothetical protein